MIIYTVFVGGLIENRITNICKSSTLIKFRKQEWKLKQISIESVNVTFHFPKVEKIEDD